MEKAYDMIVIGSGPAGLTAAIYARRALLDTLVLEREYVSGGQVVNTSQIDNYPGLPGINGYELGMQMREHADSLGAAFRVAKVRRVRTEEAALGPESDGRAGRMMTVCTDQGEFCAKTVLLATGAKHRKLGVPGEEEFAGSGVSYCATCDGAFFKGRTVAVVGGGDAAAGDAVFLAHICAKVYVIHRRDQLRASKRLQRQLEELPNVETVWNTTVEEIYGEDQVEAIRLSNKVTGVQKNLPIDGVFVAVGIEPDTTLLEEELKRDENGYIRAGEDGVTNLPGIFVAGDARSKGLRQIVTAAADGANAVESALHYLMTQTLSGRRKEGSCEI